MEGVYPYLVQGGGIFTRNGRCCANCLGNVVALTLEYAISHQSPVEPMCSQTTCNPSLQPLVNLSSIVERRRFQRPHQMPNPSKSQQQIFVYLGMVADENTIASRVSKYRTEPPLQSTKIFGMNFNL